MTYKVIDISEHQGKIDWDKAWKSGKFKAVIIRCRYEGRGKSHDDYQWTRNVSECERLKIPYGVYIYSCSDTSSVSLEINNTLRLLKGHSPELPVYIDLEQSKNGKLFLGNANKFCAAMAEKGYKTGVYSGAYLFKTYLSELDKKYSRWIAAYGPNKNGKLYNQYKPNLGEDGWQYTSTDRISGINGNVDNSIFYTNYIQKEDKEMSFAPITDYSKYKNLVSNSGGDQNGGIRGGKAGDQTGRQWRITSWYDFGQNYVIRFKDRQIANTFATVSIYAAENNKVGYDQNQRTTYAVQLEKAGWDPRKIKTACEDDCSAGVLANIKAALILTGHKKQAEKINIHGYTGNLVLIIRNCGIEVQIFTSAAYCRSNQYQLPGDINNNSSRHVNVNLGVGSKMKTSDVTGKKEVIKKVTKDKCVKQLQTALNNSYGTKLKVDGKCLEKTQKVIDKHYLYYRPRTFQNPHVRWLQQRFRQLGYNIDVDSSYGPQTERIVKQFQKKYNLEVDGYAGIKTHLKLIDLF